MKLDFPALFSPTTTVTPGRSATSVSKSDLKPLARTRPRYTPHPLRFPGLRLSRHDALSSPIAADI